MVHPSTAPPPRTHWKDSAMAHLLAIDEARRRVLDAVRPLGDEDVPLDSAPGRVLAESLRSDIDVPPFTSSAMDGFALIAGPAAALRVIGESRAGHPADVSVEPGTAVRISTGAAVPEGATAVVPVERTEPAGQDGLVRVPETTAGQHLRMPGEDIAAGVLVCEPGTRLGPAEVGAAAALGRSSVRCARRPRVVLLVTGDELTDPGEPLGPGGIYSSNGYALAAQVERVGGALVRREGVRDSAEETRAALDAALADADVVIVSGGVSVGPHDHVKDSLRALGVEERFWGVRLKPGKPTWFGVRDRVLAFGLPGNPVSAMVTFQLFARPALAAMQGASPDAARGSAVLDHDVPRNRNRDEAVRVRLSGAGDGWHAVSTGDQGSHMLTSMVGADALALIASGEGELAAGSRVEVELL
jgi:molybdopterin molybdotransferase